MKKTTLADFQFPDTSDIERQVLSDAVFNADLFPDMMQLITPDMFFNESARKTWEMMEQMYNRGEVIDAASLMGRMGKEFGNLVFSESIVPGASFSVLQHVSVLRDAAAKRNAYWFAIKLLETSVKPETTEDALAMILEPAGEEIKLPTLKQKK